MYKSFLLISFSSQQAKKCAKTMVAPQPKVIKKVQLPAHFQFFSDDKEDEKNRPIENWRKGYIDTFKSYQKVSFFFF